MKSFKDLEFEVHPITKNGIRATLELKPNVFISVIAGEGFYSGGKNGVRGPVTKVEDASSFEVAIINENLPEDDQAWEVFGWQGRDDINKLMVDNG